MQRYQPRLAAYLLESENESEFEKWERVYNSNMTCSERLDAADRVWNMAFMDVGDFNKTTEMRDGKLYAITSFEIKYTSQRARHVFFASGMCAPGCNITLVRGTCMASSHDLEWSLQFTDNDHDKWNTHLGFVDRGLFTISVVFLVMYALLFAGVIVPVVNRLQKIRRYHFTVHLAVYSTSLSGLALLIGLINLSIKSTSGWATPFLALLADVLFMGSDWFLVTLVVLLSKGWTITCRKLSARGRVVVTIFLLCYVCASMWCLIFYSIAAPKEAISYMFDSWAGLSLCAIRMFGAAWFCRNVWITLNKFQRKKGFYGKLRVLVVLWFLTLPILVIINKVVVEYHRERFLFTVSNLANFVMQSCLIMLYDPQGFFKDSFPFHASVSIMNMESLGPRKAALSPKVGASPITGSVGSKAITTTKTTTTTTTAKSFAQPRDPDHLITRAAKFNRQVLIASRGASTKAHDLTECLEQLLPDEADEEGSSAAENHSVELSMSSQVAPLAPPKRKKRSSLSALPIKTSWTQEIDDDL